MTMIGIEGCLPPPCGEVEPCLRLGSGGGIFPTISEYFSWPATPTRTLLKQASTSPQGGGGYAAHA